MTLQCFLQRVRSWASGQAGDGPPPRSAGAADLTGLAERERVLAEARVHRAVAIELGRVMQGNLAKREELRRELTQRQDISELSAAWLRLHIEELDRLITQQVATVDWHLRECHRLRHGTR